MLGTLGRVTKPSNVFTSWFYFSTQGLVTRTSGSPAPKTLKGLDSGVKLTSRSLTVVGTRLSSITQDLSDSAVTDTQTSPDHQESGHLFYGSVSDFCSFY